MSGKAERDHNALKEKYDRRDCPSNQEYTIVGGDNWQGALG